MNPLTRLFRKPAWQSKNPTQRAAAVRDGTRPELLALLAEFAQSDPEPQVRIAALRRIDDLALIERRLRGELDAEVVAVARERLTALLLRRDADPEQARAALRHVHDSSVLTRIAEEAADATLRWQAMERIDRPAFWLQRAIHDSDPSLRLRILARIEDPEALAKLADAVRKRDKRLARAAREKSENLQRAAGDSSALRRQALELADSFGQLGRALPVDREARMRELDAAWQALRAGLDTDLVRRVDGAAAMAAAALASARGERVAKADEKSASAAAETAQQAIDPSADAPPAPAASEQEVAVPAAPAAALPPLPALDGEDFDAALRAWELAAAGHPDAPAALRAHRQARRGWQAERAQAAAQAYAAALDRAQAALDRGHAVDARAAMPQGPAPAALRGRVREIEESLGKLQRWQRWSTQSVRVRLCAEVEALHGSGMHPDALAQRLRDLQQEWSRLESSDPIDPEHGLVKRFRGLCHRALAPARPYFEKRQELRSQHAGIIDALLAKAAQLGDDAGALGSLRPRVIEALRDLDEVPPQRRQQLGRALRALRTRIDGCLDTARADAEAAKRRVIAQLRRDLSALSGEAAIARAKQAQSEWKSLARARREVEEALWSELRGLIDPLFAAARASQESQQAEETGRMATARRLIDEARALAASGDERLQHLDSHVETLRAQWRALASPAEGAAPPAQPRARSGSGSGFGSGSGSGSERGAAGARRPPRQADPLQPLEREFDRALEGAAQASTAARQRAEREQIDAFVDWVARWPSADTSEESAGWLARIGCPAGLQSGLLAAARHDDAADLADPARVLEARRQVVRVELAGGLPSADEDAELRRGEQMKLLAEKLSGGAAAPTRLRVSLFELAAMPGLDRASRMNLLQRLRAALLAKPN